MEGCNEKQALKGCNEKQALKGQSDDCDGY